MQEKILNLIKTKGPVLPREISKDLGLDSLFTAAHLSELVDQKKLKLSHTKIGGSPVYYLPEQSSRLSRLVDYLNEKDKKAHDFLKEKKIVQDKALSPLFQVAMRNIKDFAVPLKVNKTELFWKYYLVTDQEAVNLIKEILMEREKPKSQPAAETRPAVSEVKPEQPKAVVEKAIVQEKPEKKEQKEPKEEKKQVQKVEKEKGIEKEGPKQKQKKATRTRKKKTALSEDKQKEIEDYEDQKDFAEDIKDKFFEQIKAFCNKKNIKILEVDIIRKEKEIQMTLLVPTTIGDIEYFAKAKSKKRSNDGDLSTTYIQAQSKNMPALYLTPGDISKKAMEMVGKEFKQLIIQKLE
ncbi:hypothetical protein GF371_03375 [Candidatus Woesearchaeota archaeon]|nr:hypothetical protein [Candidatus Woesearchaeota archaeon]